jgi:hypothetical protein
MSTITKRNGISIQTQLEDLDAGMKAGLPSGVTLPVNGQMLDGTAISTLLEQALAPFAAVEAARVNYEQSLTVRNASAPSSQRLLKNVLLAVEAYCNGDATKLAQFGIASPKEKRQLTSEELVARAQKAAETRKLRGTLGKRQKESIKSQSDVSVTITSTLPGAPSTPASNGSENGASNGITGVATANVVNNGAAH